MKKDLFPKLKRFYFETSFVPVKLIIGKREEAQKYRDWFFGKKVSFIEPDNDRVLQGQTFHAPGHNIIIWLPHKPRNIRNLGTLIHELTHAIEKISWQCGINLTPETSEFFAYLMNDLFEKMCEAMKIRIK